MCEDMVSVSMMTSKVRKYAGRPQSESLLSVRPLTFHARSLSSGWLAHP